VSDDIRAETVLERVGGYRVLRRIATGGTSDVLLARAEGPHGFGRTVVLKRLLTAYVSDQSFARMFVREASAYARLSHPAIVKLYDFLSVEGGLVQVLEHVDGLPLNRLRASLRGIGHVLDDRAAIYTASRIFAALAAAHNARDIDSGEFAPVIHRDVNPSNVLIPWDGFVKLSDFGVAKVAGMPGDTQAGLIKGTFGYMAPEQVRGEGVSVRADIYAGALVLWELLARRKAIQRGALPEIEVLRAMAEPSIVSLDVLRPDVHESVRNAVRRALEPKPDKRAISADEMVAVLRAAVPPEQGRESLVAAMTLVRPIPALGVMTPSEGLPSVSDTVPDPAPNQAPERNVGPAKPFSALVPHGAPRPRTSPPPAVASSRPPPPLQANTAAQPSSPPFSASPSTRAESSRPWTLRYSGAAPQPPSPPRIPAVVPRPSVTASSPAGVNGASKGSIAPTLLSSAVRAPPADTLPAPPLVPPRAVAAPLPSLARTLPLPSIPLSPPAAPSTSPPIVAPSVAPSPPVAIPSRTIALPSTSPPPASPPNAPPIVPSPFPTSHFPAALSPSPPMPLAPAELRAPQIHRTPTNPAFSGLPSSHTLSVPPGAPLLATPLRSSRAKLLLVVALVTVSGLVALWGTLWLRTQRSRYGRVVVTAASTRPSASLLSGEPVADANVSLSVSASSAPFVGPPPGAITSALASPPASATPVASAGGAPSASTSVPARRAPIPSAGMGALNTTDARGGHRIFVDGKVLGQTPDTVYAECGPRKVKIGSAGVERRVDVPCGGEIAVTK
jgi:eukaryotic-like serine/threonine-protein kinase